MTTAAMYLRQSLDREGNAVAVARQREDCAKLCIERGWEPVEYVDNDTSASSGKKRIAYEQMLSDIAEGKIGAVVAWDLDRLHRRPVELEHFINIADQHKLALATVSGDVDLSDPQGRLIARLKGSVARHEIEQKSKRQKRAAVQKAERGIPNWRHAFGYVDHELDPVTAPLVAEAYRAIIAGASLGDVCALFNDAGAHTVHGNPWTVSPISQFLRKARNAGLREHNGAVVGKGTWPALVDEDTWRAAMAVMDAPGRTPGRKAVRRHLLTGVLRCGVCGGHLSGNWVMKRDGSHAIDYTCKACRRCGIRAANVEPLVYKLIGGRLARPDAVDLLKSDAHDAAEAERLTAEANVLYAQIREAEAEYDEGIIDGRRLAARRERVAEKLAVIEAAQQDQERLRVFDGIPLGTPEAVDAVRELTPDRLRAVIDVLVVLTVKPVGKRGNKFNKRRVVPDWKR